MNPRQQVEALREVALAGVDSREGLRHVAKVLDWAAAYVGRGIVEGLYEHTSVPADRALEAIEEMRDLLGGAHPTWRPDDYLRWCATCEDKP